MRLGIFKDVYVTYPATNGSKNLILSLCSSITLAKKL